MVKTGTKRKCNVIHVRSGSGLYGAERVILTLGKNIDKRYYNLILLIICKNDGNYQNPLRVEAQRLGFEVITLPIISRINFRSFFKIRELFKNKSVDIIHGHDFKSNFYIIISSFNLKIKKVVTSHGSTKESLKKRFYLFLDDYIFYRFFNKIIAVSEKIALHLKKKYTSPGKLKLIQNGIDLQIIQNDVTTDSNRPLPIVNSSEPLFGIIGRLTPDKGHRYFLSAFQNVAMMHPSVMALIVGDGPIRKTLESQISSLGLNENVILCGVRSDMWNIYKQLNYVVIPSLTEGLPYTLLEAMAARVPVIATTVGDIPLLIHHERTGYLVNPGNIQELSNCMHRVLADPNKSEIMAQNAYRLVMEKYSAKKMASRYEALYDSLLKQTSAKDL